MSFREVEKPKLVKLTLAQAKRFRDMARFPNDRELSQARCKFLHNAISKNQFRGSEWVSVTCKETGETYRVNGKHTSTVCAEMMEEGTVMDNTHVLIRHYEGDTLEDCACLYSTFDAKQTTRSKPDIIKGFAAANPVMEHLNGRYLQSLTAGLAFNLWEGRYHEHDVQEQAILLLENEEFVSWYVNLLGSVNTGDARYNHMLRVPVVAAMARTYFRAKAAASEFWLKIRNDSEDPVNSPPRALYRWLITHTTRSIHGRSSKDKATNRELFVRCMANWNAWRKGLPAVTKYNPEQKSPAAA